MIKLRKIVMGKVLGMFVSEIKGLSPITLTKLNYTSTQSPVGRVFREINIYELREKYIEWAWKQGYLLEVSVFGVMVFHQPNNDNVWHAIENKGWHGEPGEVDVNNCVFMACHWIFEQTEDTVKIKDIDSVEKA